MKKTFLALLTLGLVACGAPEEKKEGQEAGDIKAAVCNYTLTPDSAEVYWEAYKLTDKVAVGGQFMDFNYKPGASNTTNIPEMLKGSTIAIKTNSVNSGDAVRDPKIMEFFFGVMKIGDSIEGEIKSAEGDAVTGSAVISIAMNDVRSDVPFKYEVNDGEIKLYSEIDVNDWNGQAALAKLNEKCEAKHTGPDGKNVLWPDVAVKFFVPIASDCN